MQKYVCIAKKIIKTKNDKTMEMVGLIKADSYNKLGNDLPFVAVNNTGKEVPMGEPFEGKVFLKFGKGELSNLYKIGDNKETNSVDKSTIA